MTWRVWYINPNESTWTRRGRKRVKSKGATHTIDVQAKTENEAKEIARLDLWSLNRYMNPGILFAERISEVA